MHCFQRSLSQAEKKSRGFNCDSKSHFAYELPSKPMERKSTSKDSSTFASNIDSGATNHTTTKREHLRKFCKNTGEIIAAINTIM